MIAKQPLHGYGYGKFEKEYNLQQAGYFNKVARPESERINATFTPMAYNEYLQQTFMGGIPGGLLFASVVLSLLVAGWKDRSRHRGALAGVAAFATMCLFNFMVESPPIFFVFILYSSILLTGESYSAKWIHVPDFPRKIMLACAITASVAIVYSLKKFEAQKQLKTVTDLLENKNMEQATKILNEIEPDISTSEAFYRTKASICIYSGNYKQAQEAVYKALEFTSNPDLILLNAQLSEKNGNIDEAENQYQIACGIEPHQFRPRVKLMEMYWRNGLTAKAQNIARQIILMKPKFKSEKVQLYKKSAIDIINHD